MTFDELYEMAKAVIHPRRLSEYAEAGGVGAALLSESGKVYTGVCIDTASSLGFCAEHAAAAAMITAGENRVSKMVAVDWDGRILPPCGRCREFISQLHHWVGLRRAFLSIGKEEPHPRKQHLTLAGSRRVARGQRRRARVPSPLTRLGAAKARRWALCRDIFDAHHYSGLRLTR